MAGSKSDRRIALLAGAACALAFRVWGAAAGSGAAEPGVVPAFSPGSTVSVARVIVTLSAPAGVVHYTLDGSEPTEKSRKASTSIQLNATTCVKARVFEAGRPLGPARSQTYVMIDRDLEKFRSNLPLVILNTFGQGIDRHVKKAVTARFIEARPGGATLVAPADFDGGGLISYRGNSSLRYLKRSYAFKALDDSGKARNAPILGFPADSDWVLYAPYPDKTLMRDVLAYEMFNQMGHYASRTRFVEVFVNEGGGRLSQRHYMGVFVLEEKIKRSADRVNIQKLGTNDTTTPNITGGYIFKKDHPDRVEETVPTEDGWPHASPMTMTGLRSGYPSGPGGFPADPRGFLSSRNSGSGAAYRGGAVTPNRGGRMVIVTNGNSIVIQSDDGLMLEQPTPARPAPAPQPGSTSRSFSQRLADILTPSPPNRGSSRSQPTLAGPRSAPGFAYRGNPAAGYGVAESGEQYFVTGQRNQFFYIEPKQEDVTPAQRRWLLNHLNEFERVLYGPGFADPGNGYAAYIDVDTFIDQHLLVEVTKNIDGFRFSTFFTKDRGSRIRMEPAWDWNLSFGNANGKQGWLAEYWYWPQLDDQQYSWYRRLFEDPDFGQRYVDRWGQLRTNIFAASAVNARIDALAAQLDGAQRRNFDRWPILGRKIWPNYYVGSSYADEVRWMKQWIARRLAWIEQQFVAAPMVRPTQSGAAGRTVALQAREGIVYFTLDGTDPRLPGGGVSPKAQVYREPVTLSPSAKLFARAQFEHRWSPPTR